MRTRKLLGVVALALVASLLFASVASAAPWGRGSTPWTYWARPAPRTYMADLNALNNSGVKGTVTIYQWRNYVRVQVRATGLEPGAHLQHIHGFAGTATDSVCPTLPAAGADNLISLQEGLPYYGPVLLPLNFSGGSWPAAAANGRLFYDRTFTTSTSALSPLQLRTVVLHGMTHDGAFDETIPVACGEVKRVSPHPYWTQKHLGWLLWWWRAK